MRKLIASMNVTLDGFISGPGGELDWHFPLWNDEMLRCVHEQLSHMDTILLGRVTYQAMAAYWPGAGREGSPSLSGMMNNYAKVVFSRTLSTVEWHNARLVNRNMEEEIRKLKTLAGKDLMIYGSGSIVRSAMHHGLIDEYIIWIHPVMIGQGVPFVKDMASRVDLELMQAKAFRSGVMMAHYRPAFSSALHAPVQTRYGCISSRVG
jgi:dihydrofolate reductase